MPQGLDSVPRKKGIGDCMRKNGIKNTRINGEVQKVLSNLISREIKDPRINPMTSVVEVEVAPDLKTAKVYISVLGDEASKESTRLGLKSAASYMRGQLAKTLNLRNTPELTFIMDNSIEYGVNMSKLIDEVIRDSKHDNVDENDDSEEEDDSEEDDDSEEEDPTDEEDASEVEDDSEEDESDEDEDESTDEDEDESTNEDEK